jgi:hypothetical protein
MKNKNKDGAAAVPRRNGGLNFWKMIFLEKNINVSKLSFNKEVNLLEFVEKIDNMDIAHLIDYNKRDMKQGHIHRQELIVYYIITK